MNIETLIEKLDDLEARIKSQDQSIEVLNDKLLSFNDKISNLPKSYRELDDEFKSLRKSITDFKTVESSVSQLRKDLTEKIGDIELNQKKTRDDQSKLRGEEMKFIDSKISTLDADLKNDLVNMIQNYRDEDSLLLRTVEKIEQRVEQKHRSDDDLKQKTTILARDNEKNTNRLEVLTGEFRSYSKQLDDLTSKINVLIEDNRRFGNDLNRMKASETQRQSDLNTFLEQQRINEDQRNQKFQSLEKKVSQEIEKLSSLIENINLKQNEMSKMKTEIEDSAKLFERRLKEVAELYQLFESKYMKEWDSYKNSAEKNWSNYSLINDEKQSALNNQLSDMKSRVIAVEDSNEDIRELLKIMSDEIQKGMLNLMKMTSGWKDAFDSIKDSQK